MSQDGLVEPATVGASVDRSGEGFGAGWPGRRFCTALVRHMVGKASLGHTTEGLECHTKKFSIYMGGQGWKICFALWVGSGQVPTTAGA